MLAMPTATDARGGGGAAFGGRGGGGAAFGFAQGAHSAPFMSFPSRPVAAGPVGVRSSFFMSHRQNFARGSTAVHRRRAIGSHFVTLGADGVWLDNFVYAPTILVASRPVIGHGPAQSRRLVTVKRPGAPRSGIILVRGDSKSYVIFPSRNRG